MKISRLDKPISYWSDNKKGNVFLFYISKSPLDRMAVPI